MVRVGQAESAGYSGHSSAVRGAVVYSGLSGAWHW